MVDEFGGLAKVMPDLRGALRHRRPSPASACPGTNGFVGEFMVITGTFVSERLGTLRAASTPSAPRSASSSRALYMLSVVQKMFFGPLTNPKNKHLPDINARETLALAPLVLIDLRHRPLPLDLPRSHEGLGAGLLRALQGGVEPKVASKTSHRAAAPRRAPTPPSSAGRPVSEPSSPRETH